jgi:hypothetical protein
VVTARSAAAPSRYPECRQGPHVRKCGKIGGRGSQPPWAPKDSTPTEGPVPNRPPVVALAYDVGLPRTGPRPLWTTRSRKTEGGTPPRTTASSRRRGEGVRKINRSLSPERPPDLPALRRVAAEDHPGLRPSTSRSRIRGRDTRPDNGGAAFRRWRGPKIQRRVV